MILAILLKRKTMCPKKNDLHDIYKKKAPEIRILKFDCLRERGSSIEESGSRFQISVVTGSGIRELLDKSKNIGGGKLFCFGTLFLFCFSMKWGPQRVARVVKSGKSGRKKESEYELSKREGARLLEKDWHSGRNSDGQQRKAQWDQLASGLPKEIHFLRAKLEWQ